MNLKIKRKFNENGYLIINNFYNKKKCDKFLKIIKKYSNKEFAPIMNPDRPNFLIPQITDKINSIQYLGDKANLLNELREDCKFFREVMLDSKILNILKKLRKKVDALMSQ